MGKCSKEAGCCVDFDGHGRLPGEGNNVSRLEGGGDWSWGCLGRASLAKGQLEQCLENSKKVLSTEEILPEAPKLREVTAWGQELRYCRPL